MNQQEERFLIRPAGRHLLTIGRDLIQDQYAAIVELVKNAYDADSPDVHVIFESNDKKDQIKITITDHGHGMSRDTVINKWLVPSTDDKLKRPISPKGRRMQGRKGIGRYATSLLGDDLLLETVALNGEKTEVYVEWANFVEAEYLDQVEILVSTEASTDLQGTTLLITGGKDHLAYWNAPQRRDLINELKKLVSPVIYSNSDTDVGRGDNFDIYLTFNKFLDDQDELTTQKIEPYPVFDLYDYRIAGNLNENGRGNFEYSVQRSRNVQSEKILVDFGAETGCGNLVFDIRVYDREADAIEQLIKRGFRDSEGNYVGKNEARRILNDYNGIGVYRNGFRIRPLGDADFDWLELNKSRIQNPSMKVGGNQVIGYVEIQPEELSGLEEKSARDGLRNNYAYERLVDITKDIISKLEERRFIYRQKAGLSRQSIKLDKEIDKLFKFDDVKENIRLQLGTLGVNLQATEQIISIIKEKEVESNKIAEEIKQIVAIYQGQATLGKIIYVLLHEGRRPLSFFKNQIPIIEFWLGEFKKQNDPDILDEVIPIIQGVSTNAKAFAGLFGRLDPLASGRRGKKRKFILSGIIQDAFRIFESELIAQKISWIVEGDNNYEFWGWSQDFLFIFSNLIDNSIFWITQKNSKFKNIRVNIAISQGSLEYVDYRDTGPGIETHLIESGVIFEPEFSTKVEGTGLGLAIAGECATRNGLELKAFDYNQGAYFRLQPKEGYDD